MICIYNIALCYKYKGMATWARHIRLTKGGVLPEDHPVYVFGKNASQYYLAAAVDHYTEAYELMSRFRLEDSAQYTLLMAMLNNLASTYGILGQVSEAETCNGYLVRSLILVICSSERDGHLGQEVLSWNENNRKAVLSKEEDRETFESFLSNVTHLMMAEGPNGDKQYSGSLTAAAA